MGVLGLWQILESVGHPIKIEALEGKRLGVDANVWLYKFIRGFREKDNAPNIDSHKLGLFNRISKLLFYKIKPVFVFDGPAPVLKRKTLERRQDTRNKQLVKVQGTAVRLLAEQLKEVYPGANIDDIKIHLPELMSHNLAAAEKLTDEDRELFYLPPETEVEDSKFDCEDLETDVDSTQMKQQDIAYLIDSDDDIFTEHGQKSSVDFESKEFLSLPAEVRYEMLVDKKEAQRKIRRVHALPEDAGNFSKFQLDRLKARRMIQEKIEQCERDICSNYTGDIDGQQVRSYRMQSDSNSTMLYVKKASNSIESPSTSQKSTLPPEDDSQTQCTTPTKNTKEQYWPNRVVVSQLKPLLDPSQGSPSTSMTRISAFMGELTANNSSKYVKSPSFSEPSLSEDDSESELHSIKRSETSQEISSQKTEISTQSSIEENKTVQLNSSFVSSTEEFDGRTTPKTVRTTNFSSACSTPVQILEAQERVNAHYSPQPVLLNENDSQEESKLLPGLAQSSVNETILIETSLSSQSSPTSTILIDTSHIDSPEAAEFPLRSPLSKPTDTALPDMGQEKEFSDPVSDIPPSQKPPADIVVNREKQDVPTSRLPSSNLNELRDTISVANRITNIVTSKIVDEAKELLRLFGVPYIDAAGEAEAQCALLEKLELTEGTITDDSDVWLFGAQNVYRYFFSDDKYVMQYKMSDIEYHIRMTRENLVCFAMLVGSDYTDGIMKVGPVTALEILSEFPGPQLEPLVKFKNWKTRYEVSKDRVPGSKRREKFLKLQVPDEFPSRAVFEGYMRPMADSSGESFTWGTPELDELRDYGRRNFGWVQKKIDDKLLPVMKKLNERKTQMTIDSFFFKTAASQNPELFRSKRVNEALNKIAKTQTQEVNLSEDDEEADLEAASKMPPKKRTEIKKKKPSKCATSKAARKRSKLKAGK